jgi:hypothetical protein
MEMSANPQQLANDARALVHDGKLSECDEKLLQSMLDALRMFISSGQAHMANGVIEHVEHELSRRRTEHRHNQHISELNRIHKEQLSEINRLSREASIDNDKKHGESLSISNQANALAKKAIRIALVSVLISVIIGVIAVFVAHLDRTRPSIAGTNASRTKEIPPPPTKPQIAAPTPQPIRTNAIPRTTNAPSKK